MNHFIRCNISYRKQSKTIKVMPGPRLDMAVVNVADVKVIDSTLKFWATVPLHITSNKAPSKNTYNKIKKTKI